MTAGPRRNDEHEPGDALDRAIDETLGAAMHAHTVNLRERVLVRLDEPTEAPAAWWRFVLRPALLPAAGAALLVVGVVLTWQHVDDTLARIGSRQPTSSVARAKPGASEIGASLPPSPSGLRRTSVPRPSPLVPAPVAAARPLRLRPLGFGGQASLPPSPSGLRRTSGPEAGQHVAAASLLDMDGVSKPAGVAADTVLMGDDASPAQVLPGAPAGDLGDPVKPMPPLRLIVIQPIVSAPIVEAPPISTLAPPFSTVPTVGEISRDPSDPGKPGGVRQ